MIYYFSLSILAYFYGISSNASLYEGYNVQEFLSMIYISGLWFLNTQFFLKFLLSNHTHIYTNCISIACLWNNKWDLECYLFIMYSAIIETIIKYFLVHLPWMNRILCKLCVYCRVNQVVVYYECSLIFDPRLDTDLRNKI